jgi:hypothetical protein
MDTNPLPPPDILGKVRALLAKAESTEFPAEAEALTLKAQQLMARHDIEQAMLDEAPGGRGGAPSMEQVVIDAPHADAKVRVLIAVAQANRCTVIWTPGLRRASVFGFADDLAAVMTLFTSLLLQATVAVNRAGPQRDRYGRTCTVSYRRSFLIAFASRIGERLQEAVDAIVREVSSVTGADLVPMFDRRRDAVDAAVREAFPRTRRMTTSVASADGWFAGKACADRADLGGHGGFDRLDA